MEDKYSLLVSASGDINGTFNNVDLKFLFNTLIFDYIRGESVLCSKYSEA